MSTLQQDIRKKILLGQDGNALVILLSVNVIAYIILAFIKVIYLVDDSTTEAFRASVYNWLTVPAPTYIFGTQPWSIISYMFVHFDFIDLFSNMIWLWCFGYILQDQVGNSKLVPAYLYGGLVASIAFLLSVNLIPSISQNINSVYPLEGSGPAIVAVAVAATTFFPKYKVFSRLNFPLWGLTLVFVFIKIGTVGKGNYGQAIALLGGGVTGFLFAWQLQQGNDWGQWMTDVVNWANNLLKPGTRQIPYSPKDQFFYKTTQTPYQKTPHVTQRRVDDLLDKINSKGYNSLTDEEKEFLKKASAEDL